MGVKKQLQLEPSGKARNFNWKRDQHAPYRIGQYRFSLHAVSRLVNHCTCTNSTMKWGKPANALESTHRYNHCTDKACQVTLNYDRTRAGIEHAQTINKGVLHSAIAPCASFSSSWAIRSVAASLHWSALAWNDSTTKSLRAPTATS